MHHDIPIVGYRERWKMTELVTKNYWQYKVTKDIEKYMEGYNMYQRMKNKTEILAGKLNLSEIPEKL